MLSTYYLTGEQIEIQNLARDFARREILPVSKLYEQEDLSKGALLKAICQSGLINIRVPSEFGGLGLSLLETCLIIEEIAFACSGIASIIQASELAITPLLLAGSLQQKQVYLTPLLNDATFAGMALQNAGSVKQSWALIAKKESDSFLLNGYCPFVLNAHGAHWFLIACPTDAEIRETNSYFIVPSDIAGLHFSERIKLIGLQAADIRAVNFENVRLKPLAKIDLPCFGLESHSNSIIAAGYIGIAKSAFEQGKKYAQQRKTFGVPIVNHQAIAFMLANMATEIEAARLLNYQAAELLGNGTDSIQVSRSAQAFAEKTASAATIDSVQIFGGYGYTKDYPVEKLMRDARTYKSVYTAANNIQESLGQTMLDS